MSDCLRAELLHDPVLLLAGHAAVEDLNLELRKNLALQEFGFGDRGFRVQGLGLLHQRANHERLPAILDLAAHQLPGLHAVHRAESLGVDRNTPRRQLVDHGYIEIAVEHHVERARNRRCRHRKDMRLHRARPRRQQAPLAHAETVLLVDHHQAQRIERDPFLEERMSSDQNVDRTGLQFRHELGAFFFSRRSGEKSDAGLLVSGRPSKSFWKFCRCCSARISVGATTATW